MRYVAFLRAVNVGGRIVKMAELQRLFTDAGFTEVSTFIASGNVIFGSKGASAALERRIESALQQALGYAVPTMLRSLPEVARISVTDPFAGQSAGEVGPATLYVGLLKAAVSAEAVRKTVALSTPVDSLHVDGREVYWLGRKGVAESTLAHGVIEKALGTPVTFRNVNTLRRLAAKFPLDVR